MPRSADPAYLEVLARARRVMATYADMEELIRLGAYRPGSSAEVDEAIGLTLRWRPSWPRQDRIHQPGRGLSALGRDLARRRPRPEPGQTIGLGSATEKSGSLPLRRPGNRKLTLSRHTHPGCPL